MPNVKVWDGNEERERRDPPEHTVPQPGGRQVPASVKVQPVPAESLRASSVVTPPLTHIHCTFHRATYSPRLDLPPAFFLKQQTKIQAGATLWRVWASSGSRLSMQEARGSPCQEDPL